jgi:hypothetical protein
VISAERYQRITDAMQRLGGDAPLTSEDADLVGTLVAGTPAAGGGGVIEARYDINPAPDVTTEKELRQLMRENGEKSQQDHDRFIKRIDKQNAKLRDTLTSLREANADLRAEFDRTDEAIAKLRAAVQRLCQVEPDAAAEAPADRDRPLRLRHG